MTNVNSLGKRGSRSRPRVPQILFWIGALFTFVLAGVAGWDIANVYRLSTWDEASASIWFVPGPVFLLWAFSVPLGVAVAYMGVLLDGKRRGAILMAVALFVVSAFIVMLQRVPHFPPLFGIGGALIIILFFALLWFWMQRRPSLEGKEARAADFQLLGYISLINAAWFSCGALSAPHQLAFVDRDPATPLHIMVFFVVGWAFLALHHYQLRETER